MIYLLIWPIIGSLTFIYAFIKSNHNLYDLFDFETFISLVLFLLFGPICTALMINFHKQDNAPRFYIQSNIETELIKLGLVKTSWTDQKWLGKYIING